MKTYKFEITIVEGNDEYWEKITDGGKTGCDEVLQSVLDALDAANFTEYEFKLIEYKDK